MKLNQEMHREEHRLDDRAHRPARRASAAWSRSCRSTSRSRRRSRSTGVKPYTPLQLAGRDIYLREGCYNCHSQMIRPFRAETERYGHYSVAGEFVYDHPFQWGSKRTGPDLARVGGALLRRLASRAPQQSARRRSRIEHAGLSVACEDAADAGGIQAQDDGAAPVGVPYTDAEIAKAPDELKGKTEQDALIAYLQDLGLALQEREVSDEHLHHAQQRRDCAFVPRRSSASSRGRTAGGAGRRSTRRRTRRSRCLTRRWRGARSRASRAERRS